MLNKNSEPKVERVELFYSFGLIEEFSSAEDAQKALSQTGQDNPIDLVTVTYGYSSNQAAEVLKGLANKKS